MNVRIRLSRRTRLSPGGTSPRRALGACAGLATLVLAAGCSVAPPGAVHNSPEVGPVRTGTHLKNFPVFPVPDTWTGLDSVDYTMVVKPKTGYTARNFRVIAKSDMVFWLNCIGKGKAQLASATLGLKWDIPCDSGADPKGLNFRPKSAAVGHGANVEVTVTRNSQWEVRIDVPTKN